MPTSSPAGIPNPPPAGWRDVAPDVLATFRTIEAVASRSVPASLLVPIRRSIAAVLGIASPDDARVEADERLASCLEFAEQFVVDVAGITDAQRQAMMAAMGADSFTFVQVLYVADVFTRARIAIGALFDDRLDAVGSVGSTETSGVELWPLLERFMQQVALLSALDPLITELVRLRGAQVHNCRLCQSRRSVKAIDAAGSADVFDNVAVDDPGLSDRARVALALTDALVTQPGAIDSTMVADVHAHFDVAEITEIVLDVARNAANKIAVALGGDAPVVGEGVEFYDIDASGDVVADVDINVVRSATAR